MAKAPRLSSKRLCKRLEKLGAVQLPGRGKGSHAFYQRQLADGTLGRTPVPTGCDVVLPKTLASICKKLGIAIEDL